MRTEIRFLLAVVLMIAVLVVTNLMFPPVPPEERPGYQAPDSGAVAGPMQPVDSQGVAEGSGDQPFQIPPAEETGALTPPSDSAAEAAAARPPPAGDPGQAAEEPPGDGEARVHVEGPLYEFTFTNRGGRLLSARLLEFPSFTFEGPVELVSPESDGALGTRLLVGSDTLDLRNLIMEVDPPDRMRLSADGDPRSLRFRYEHPTHPFTYEVSYTFHPEGYIVDVAGNVSGLDARVVYTGLGNGIPFNEQREEDDARASAYVLNHLREGIRAQPLDKVDGTRVEEGPFVWAAFKSKYFVLAILAGAGEEEETYLGGVVVQDGPGEYDGRLTAAQSVKRDGSFAYRLFMGPQEFARLSQLGSDMQDVNPYGWKFFRPVIRPFVGIIMAILNFLHENLNLGYGWVLIVFGVLMRVVLFPLNQKAMRAQIKNMAVQPLIQEIQAKHKDNPEKLQKEMMKLYKDHGFNPLAGCLPMLLPWPVLITLFFVFQNTIALRGVPFLWLPDLSAPDPYFILPAFLGLSMFLLQWVSMKSMPQTNPQMKMMMYIMPVMMVFIFFQLASGLNLYYATANIATLPQQIFIARERKRAQAREPLKLGT
ncbi:MAG: membrane protein insertase YidC [Longimicrobiales bacterium]